MFGVVPQIIPPFVSFTIYRWDINIRMSTIIGIVGGGGIGYILVQWIRNWKYQEAGIAVWFIAITVAVLDYVSAEIQGTICLTINFIPTRSSQQLGSFFFNKYFLL